MIISAAPTLWTYFCLATLAFVAGAGPWLVLKVQSNMPREPELPKEARRTTLLQERRGVL